MNPTNFLPTVSAVFGAAMRGVFSSLRCFVYHPFTTEKEGHAMNFVHVILRIAAWKVAVLALLLLQLYATPVYPVSFYVIVSKATDFGGGSTSPGTENVRFLQLGVMMTDGTSNITSVKAKFTSSSSAVNADISAFNVYEDKNGNGEIDGDDAVLGTVLSPDLTNGATVTGLSFGVTTTTKYLLLVLDIAGGADGSHTVGLELTDKTFITASPWAAKSTNFPIQNTSDKSLPVELSSFTAQAGDGEVTLHWVTESETDNLGFHVYRALPEDEGYQRLTTELIEGAGSTTGSREYAFTDGRLTNGVTYWYKLEDVAYDGTTKMHGPISVVPQQVLPTAFGLSQNVPNPFNPQTTIAYQLSEASDVRLTVCNAAGQLVQVLVDAAMEAGVYTITWDARGFGSGIYLVRLEAGTFIETRKMVKIE